MLKRWILCSCALAWACGARGATTTQRETAAPTPAPQPTAAAPDNPYLAPLQREASAWRTARMPSYVFVLAHARGGVESYSEIDQRVVVQNGRVVSTEGLAYGGSVPADAAPTMDTLFEHAHEAATFGEAGVPARFEAHYDPATHALRSVEADGRLSVADDETSIQVTCFSSDVRACQPTLLTSKACRAARGLPRPADGTGCPNGEVVGRLSATEICCKAWQ